MVVSAMEKNRAGEGDGKGSACNLSSIVSYLTPGHNPSPVSVAFITMSAVY